MAEVPLEMNNRIPIIVILGATGSGKSKLGIEIARQFGGEIISADSMQVYKGLDIITNKVTSEEKCSASHHLLDIVEPLQRFSVLDFRNKALPIIEQLLKVDKLPVIVGGTNYYIESLLWRVLVAEENEVESEVSGDKGTSDDESKNNELMYEKDRKRLLASQSGDVENKKIKLEDEEINIVDEAVLESKSSQSLYEKLKSIDPAMAEQLHPNNKRKIIRSLQVFMQTGRRHSDILQEQRSAKGGSELGGPLRYPHSCILWLQCQQEVLDKRLDSRVDTMLEQGLVQELISFHQRYNAERLNTETQVDYTKGIFQSIGFKEFHEYLTLDPEERKTEKGIKLLEAGVTGLKQVTRRYARRQIRWITNRFLRRPTRQVPPVYGLDATDPSQWKECVLEPAMQIVENFMKGQRPLNLEPLPIVERYEKNEMKTFKCEVCDRIFVGDLQWNVHLKSKKHHKMLKRQNLLTKSEKVDK